MTDEDVVYVTPGGRPKKHVPYPATAPTLKRRPPEETDRLLEHCRQNPGSWVLLDVRASARSAADMAGRWRRRRRNGPGRWEFVARTKTLPTGRVQHGVYGVWRPEEAGNGK